MAGEFAKLEILATMPPKTVLKDVKVIEKAIRKLNKEIEKLGKTKGNEKEIEALKKIIEGLTASLTHMKTAANSAKIAQKELSQEQKKSAKDSKEAAAQAQRLAEAQERATIRSTRYKMAQRNLNVAVRDFDKMMSIALQKLIRYRMIFYTGRAIMEAYKKSLQTTVAVGYEMIQIQKVMADEQFRYNSILKTATDTAIKYGITVTESLKGMKVWAQQGKTAYEIQQLHTNTLLLSATANMTAAESVEALTAATRAYKLDLSELTGIVDMWMNVQRKHAVTAQDLANALKVVANAAQMVGVDIADLAANVTAIVAVTRKSGTAVANSLKTMFSRFSRPVAQGAFSEIGISIQSQVDMMRDFDDVLDELFVKWDTLTDAQKVNTAYAMGGVRRYADFMALMENYGEKLQVVSDAHSSFNEASRALNIELSSMKRTFASLKASGEVLGLHIGKVFVGSDSIFALAAQGLNHLVQNFPKATAALGTFLGTFGKTAALMAGVAIVKTMTALIKNFTMEVGRGLITRKIEAARLEELHRIRQLDTKEQIKALAVGANEIVAIDLKKAKYKELTAEVKRLTTAYEQETVISMQNAVTPPRRRYAHEIHKRAMPGIHKTANAMNMDDRNTRLLRLQDLAQESATRKVINAQRLVSAEMSKKELITQEQLTKAKFAATNEEKRLYQIEVQRRAAYMGGPTRAARSLRRLTKGKEQTERVALLASLTGEKISKQALEAQNVLLAHSSGKVVVATEAQIRASAFLAAEEERLAGKILKRNAAQAASGKVGRGASQLATFGKGLWSMIGGWYGVGFIGITLAIQGIMRVVSKAKNFAKDYATQLAENVSLTKDMVNLYEIYARKIANVQYEIGALRELSADGLISSHDAIEREEQMINNLNRGLSYLAIQQQRLQAEGDERAFAMGDSLDALKGEDDIIPHLQELSDALKELSESFRQNHKMLWNELTDIAEGATESLAEAAMQAQDFIDLILYGDSLQLNARNVLPFLWEPGGDANFSATMDEINDIIHEQTHPDRQQRYLEILFSGLDQNAAQSFNNDMTRAVAELQKNAVSKIDKFNATLLEAASTGGPIVAKELSRIFEGLEVKIDIEKHLEFYKRQLESGIPPLDAFIALQNSIQAEWLTIASKMGDIGRVEQEVADTLKSMDLKRSIEAALGDGFDVPAQAIVDLGESWESLMNKVYAISGPQGGKGISLYESLTEALQLGEEDRDEWLKEKGDGLKGAFDKFFGDAISTAQQTFNNLGPKVQEITSVDDIFSQIVAKMFSTKSLDIGQIKEVISYLGSETQNMLDRYLDRARRVSELEQEKEILTEQERLLGKGIEHEEERAKLKREILDIEHRIEMINAESNSVQQQKLQIDYRGKQVLLEIELIYDRITAQAERQLDLREKISREENAIYRILGKISGKTKTDARLMQLQNQLAFNETLLQQQREANFEMSARLTRELALYGEIGQNDARRAAVFNKMVDLSQKMYGTQEKIAEIEDEIRMIPLLNDLEKVQLYLKKVEKTWKTIAKGFASGLSAIPEAMVSNQEDREDYYKEIAEAEEELANLRKKLGTPGVDYAATLEQIDQLSGKIQDARRDVERWTGAMAIVKEAASGVFSAIGNAYFSLVEEQFADLIQKFAMGKTKFNFEGQIISASATGSQSFYNAIVLATRKAYAILTGTARDYSPGVRFTPSAFGFNRETGEVTSTRPSVSTGVGLSAQNMLTGEVSALGVTMRNLSGNVGANTSAASTNTGAIDANTGATNVNTNTDAQTTGKTLEGFNALAGYLGVVLGTAFAGNSQGASQGAAFGGMLSSAMQTAGWLSGGWGFAASLALPILGGFVGDALSGSEEELDLNVEALNNNTSAVNKNTQAIDDLISKVINAPSLFTIPALAGMGGGGGMQREYSRTGSTKRNLI